MHFLRRHARRVIAFEPIPALERALRRKFRRGIVVEFVALSDKAGTFSLHVPVADGAAGRRAIVGPMDRLDAVYDGNVGFIRVDVGGCKQAVLDGAVETIQRCQPRLLGRARPAPIAGGHHARRGLFL